MERGDFYVRMPAKCEEGKEFREECRKKGCDQITKISTKSRKTFNISLSYTARHQIFPQPGANNFVDTHWTQTEPNSVSRIYSCLHYCDIYYLFLPYEINWALGSTLGCLLVEGRGRGGHAADGYG